MKRAIALSSLLLCAACATTAAPGAEKIRITTSPKDVEGCKLIGDVNAPGPFNLPDDWKTQLRNATLAAGGDVVFRTGPLALTDHVTGMAYRCGNP